MLPEDERIDHAEAFFAAIGADIQHGGAPRPLRAEPGPVQDAAIRGVPRSVAYYATLAHKVTHFTGHASQCSRDLLDRFGEEAYAAEKLVAELGAAFVCADLALAP